MDAVLAWLEAYQYLAMFAILFLCGVGLPIPEEITLVGSGIVVGLGKAEFIPASLCCVAGILAGDSIIFGMGHHFGDAFLRSRPMRLFLSEKRQLKVAEFFAKHGKKTVFFARFFAGVRIGVYAYAGSRRMTWPKFLWLDLLGALISGPTSVAIGWAAARMFPIQQAIEKAKEWVHRFGFLLLIAMIGAIAILVAIHYWRRGRRDGGGPMKAVVPEPDPVKES